MKLSKQQIEVLADSLSHPFGLGVHLMCDGYKITLRVERSKNMTYRVMTYVDGYFKGIWCGLKKEHPEQKFMRKQVRPVCSPAHKKQVEKTFGKLHVKNDPFFSETWTTFWPDWPNGKAALNHLNKVCESIQLAE
ncbi:MAG: hypothetical protein Q7S51_10230 [Gallionellaceae bacterium]|nr:hypothetical protein [Gallionellaceae bacterium]